MRRLAAILLALVFLAAPAAAFKAADAEVDIAYASTDTPLVLGLGQVTGEGDARGMLLLLGNNGTRLGPIPSLVVTHISQNGIEETRVADGTLIVHDGTLVWRNDTERVKVRPTVDYGLGLGIPSLPVGDEKKAPPGFVVTGPEVNGTLRFDAPHTELLLANASVTILDADGKAVADWDHRRVNAEASPTGDIGNAESGTRFEAAGAFPATLRLTALAGGLGAAPHYTMSVGPAAESRFKETAQRFADFAANFGGGEGDGGGFGGQEGALDSLASVSGILNGAIILIAQAQDGGDAPTPLAASVRGKPAELGAFTVFRSRDMSVDYEGPQMRVQGDSAVSVTKAGFDVDAPATLGLVPLLSVFLWCVAVGAVIVRFVKRPPKGKTRILYRLVGAGVNLVVLLGVFYVWDQSFAATFGTSFLNELRITGLSTDALPQLLPLLGLEMIPWGLAMLLFALPVRIALGVALRYLGKGKSFSGVANAGGLVALGVLGPIYALWLLNVMVGVLLDGLARAGFGT